MRFSQLASRPPSRRESRVAAPWLPTVLAVEPHPKQREQEQARQAAAHAEQERLQNEQEAAGAGVLRQHVATLPKYDYKVLTLSSKIWSGKVRQPGTGTEQARQGGLAGY